MREAHEDGAVAITTALLLTVLILLAAFLVDLGGTRADARSDQLLADTAVMAGANFEGSAVEQCEEAVKFVAANLSAGYDSSPCSSLPADCNLSTAPHPTSPMSVGAYTIVVTHPVPNDDATMEVEGQGLDPARDGTPCDRIKVEIQKTRDFTFGAAGGAGDQGSSMNDAVAVRHREGNPSEYATLVLLEQEECMELTSVGGGSGGSGVVIQNEYEDDGSLAAAGIIHLDSSGLDPGNSCNGNNRIVDAGSSGNSAICSGVDGRDPGNLASIFTTPVDCGDVLEGTMRAKGGDNLVLPQFVSGGANDEQLEDDPLTVDFRITRSIVDHEYNCLSDPDSADTQDTYPTSGLQYPASGLVEPVPYCGDEARSPHIDELIAATIGSAGPPGGFETVGCSPADDPVVEQYVYVACETMPSVAFESDVVVLEGGHRNPDGINGGNVSVEPHSAGSAIVVVREGNIRMSTGDSFNFDRTFVYLHDGDMSITGGENLTWVAPDVVGYNEDTGASENCQPVEVTPGVDVPHPSCFQNLALWSNDAASHSMAGSGEIDVQGVFFTPNADFSLSGSGGAGPSPLRLEDAQFFTRTLSISGGSRVAMKPNADIFLETPPPTIALIR